MGCLLVCDAPLDLCSKSIPAENKQGRPGAPDGWWLVTGKGGRLIVACCERHLLAAQKADARAAA